MFKNKNTYIEYDNTNNQWNNGHITVYIKGNLQEHIFVNDIIEDNTNDIYTPENIIDNLKQKYSISKVIKIEHNWR